MGGGAAVLGGGGGRVCTGGVGEDVPERREVVSRQFGFLGLKLDSAKNAAPARDQEIAGADSEVRVFVIHAEEEQEIARECYRLVSAPGAQTAPSAVSVAPDEPSYRNKP